MTPLESGLLHSLGIHYWKVIEQLSIFIFFYGTSSSLDVRGTMRLIHQFDNRSVCYTLLCISCYLCVRFFSFRKLLIRQQDLITEILQAERIFYPRDSSRVCGDRHCLSPLQFECWS